MDLRILHGILFLTESKVVKSWCRWKKVIPSITQDTRELANERLTSFTVHVIMYHVHALQSKSLTAE